MTFNGMLRRLSTDIRTFTFPSLDFDVLTEDTGLLALTDFGSIRNRYCGLFMNVGNVQFPPQLVEKKRPFI